MTLALATSPAIVVNTSNTNDTSTNASHTPGSGSAGISGWSWNTGGSGNSPSAPAVTSSDGGTWTLSDHSRRGDGVTPVVDSQCAIHWRQIVTGVAMTDTVVAGANTGATGQGGAQKTWIFTGANTTNPIGAHGKGSKTGVSSFSVSYTKTVAGSQAVLVVADWDLTGTMSAGANTTLTGGGSGSAGTEISYGFFLESTAGGNVGDNVTLNVTLAGASNNIRYAYAEIVPPSSGAAAAASLSFSETLTAAASVTAVAAASLAESWSLTAGASVTAQAAAALSEAVTLIPTATVTTMAGATLSEAVTLSATAVATAAAAASLAGSISMTAGANTTALASAGLGTSFGLTATATVTAQASTAMSESVALSAAATVTAMAAASMSETFTFSGTALGGSDAMANLGFSVGFSASATVTAAASAGLGLHVDLAATGNTPSDGLQAGLGFGIALSATAGVTRMAAAALSSALSLTATMSGGTGGGGMPSNELKYARMNTHAFIADNPRTIVLIPRTRVKTGGGTSLVDGTPRAPQVMRVIDQTRTFGPEPGRLVGADGTQRKLEYQLLGDWDAIIGKDDYWQDADGVLWTVKEVLPNLGYEVRAQVMRFSDGPVP